MLQFPRLVSIRFDDEGICVEASGGMRSVIIAQYAEGASFEELAAQHACAWQTIRRFLIANDIPLREPLRRLKLDPFETEIRQAHAAGAGFEDLAQRYRVQPVTVRRFLAAKKIG